MGCCCCPSDDKLSLKPQLKRGQSCTDCFCFLIFIIFLTGMALITTLTIMDDGLYRLVYGFDSYGNICNRKNVVKSESALQYNGQDTTGLKFVFYFNYTEPIKSKKVCVRECPDVMLNSTDQMLNYSLSTNNSLCFYNVSLGEYHTKLCPSLPIPRTMSIANRCMPYFNDLMYNSNKMIKGVERFLNADYVRMSIVQLINQLPNIGYLSLSALLLTIILVFLLRYIAKVMVLLVLLLSSVGSIALSAFLWWKYTEVKKQMELMLQADRAVELAPYTVPIIGIEMDADTAYLTYSIIATVFTVIFLLIIIILRKRIGLVIRLFAEAQKALVDMPMLFVIPLCTFCVLAMFLLYWLMTAFMIYSFGDYSTDTSNVVSEMHSLIDRKVLSKIMWAYHIVALVWVSEFIFACQSMVVAISVAKWYFTRDKTHLKTPICTALKRLIVYNMGSVALGAFLITLIRIPRYFLMYLQDKIKASGSTFAEYCSKGCICCLWCLEKFMKFINYNAYTIIAIEGRSFCTSAQKAFAIIVENNLRVAAINSVGDFMLLLAKIAVTAINLLFAVLLLEVPINSFDIEKFPTLPLACVAIISFLIAHCFFTVYEMVIDALMVCFCEDCRANDGSEERPYFMSNSLKEFVDESSTQITINH